MGGYLRALVTSGALLCAAAACSADGGAAGGSSGGGGGGGSAGSGGFAGNTGGTGGFGNQSSGGSAGIGVGGQGTGGGGGLGTGGACARYSATSDAAVDIIWIVDNSCSMGDEIDKIRTNINSSFVDIISQSNLAWNLTFISYRADFPAPLFGGNPLCIASPPAGPNCTDNPPRFHHVACTVGSTNSLGVARKSFDGTPLPQLPWPEVWEPFTCEQKLWQPYLRFQATKVFVVVTDDEYVSDPMEFDTWLTEQAQPDPFPGMFGSKQNRKYVFNGIIGMDPSDPSVACTSASNSAVAPGLKYQQLAQATGGQVASICEDDWTTIFESVANTLVERLGCEYPVPPPPAGETLDPNRVNVKYTHEDGTEEDILQDNNAACDGGADGWQWNADKTKVVLCGNTCERLKNDPKARVDIIFGCDTKIAPPR